MFVSLSTPIQDRRGGQMMDGETAVTAGFVLLALVDAVLPEDVHMAAATRARLAVLGIWFAAGGKVALKATDIELLLDRASRMASPLVLGQLIFLLDPARLEA
jgi:hypothetical protein